MEIRVRQSNDLALGQRWPDLCLSKYFQTLLRIYGGLLNLRLNGHRATKCILSDAYKTLCTSFRLASYSQNFEEDQGKSFHQSHVRQIHTLIKDLRRDYADDWLQAVASMFGMLMHFSVPKRSTSYALVNYRRPKQSCSSYPNSPALARIVAERVAAHVFTTPVPAESFSAESAERYAEQALQFRIIDPSMESGQLLVEIARAVIHKIYKRHSPSTKSAARLARALIEKLCRDCLWGIDRDAKAVNAVHLSFALLGRELNVGELLPSNLFTADAFNWNGDRAPHQFDAIVNNPPWGESLRRAERACLRAQFKTLEHHADTYVAFSELALQWLRPGGLFTLVLPSQVLAARNTCRLRALLAETAELDEIILLPRAAFVFATVRGVLIVGRRRPTAASRFCKVLVHPIIKNLQTIGPVHASRIDCNTIRSHGGASWWPFVAGGEHPFARRSVPLSRMARVLSGVKVYERGKGIPRQTAAIIKQRRLDVNANHAGAKPAIEGRNVHDFRIANQSRYINLGKWLACQGQHQFLEGSKRVFVRELCRRDGKLTAAVPPNGVVPLRGVLTVMPLMINAQILTGILNSQTAAAYVRGCAASFTKVDFQRITIAELYDMPIPVAAIHPKHRASLGLARATRKEVRVQQRLLRAVKNLSSQKPKDYKRSLNCVERAVKTMYGARS